MTWPFSAARIAAPSGASMLMPVCLLAMKSVMTLPETGQRNLSAPDITGSAEATGLTAGAGAVASGAGAAVVVVVLDPRGVAAAIGVLTGLSTVATFMGAGAALAEETAVRPGMMIF